MKLSVGAWIAVSWGSATKRPAGGSFRLSLICIPEPIASIQTVQTGKARLVRKLIERYDHRALTDLDLVPESFLRQVGNEMLADVASLKWQLLAVELQDHDEWCATYALPGHVGN